MINDEKMSKSLGNFFTIRDVLKEYDAETIRFFLLSAQYRSALNYSQENLDNAKSSLSRLYTALRDVKVGDARGGEEYVERFKSFMDDDFNTPGAISVLFELAKAVNTAKEEEASGLAGRLVELASVLGLLYQDPVKYLQGQTDGVDDDVAVIESLIEERKQARARKDFAAADEARNKLTAMGVVLEDGPMALLGVEHNQLF